MTQIVFAALRVLNPAGGELSTPLAREIELARKPAASGRGGPAEPSR